MGRLLAALFLFMFGLFMMLILVGLVFLLAFGAAGIGMAFAMKVHAAQMAEISR